MVSHLLRLFLFIVNLVKPPNLHMDTHISWLADLPVEVLNMLLFALIRG